MLPMTNTSIRYANRAAAEAIAARIQADEEDGSTYTVAKIGERFVIEVRDADGEFVFNL